MSRFPAPFQLWHGTNSSFGLDGAELNVIFRHFIDAIHPELTRMNSPISHQRSKMMKTKCHAENDRSPKQTYHFASDPLLSPPRSLMLHCDLWV